MNYHIVEIQPMKENTREELDRYLSEISAVVRDKDIKNPNKLTDRLMKESYGDKASSVLSFVPCVVNYEAILDRAMLNLKNPILQLFGFGNLRGAGDTEYNTNLRELLNLGIDLDEALQYVDFTHYKAFTARVPNFVYSQIRTHSQINFLQQSNRYVETDYGYFMPEEVTKLLINIKKVTTVEEAQEHWNSMVVNTSPIELVSFMKDCGVKRKEVYNRGADSLRIRPFAIGINTLNPNAGEHFFNERGKSLHTQAETSTFVNKLKEYM